MPPLLPGLASPGPHTHGDPQTSTVVMTAHPFDGAVDWHPPAVKPQTGPALTLSGEAMADALAAVLDRESELRGLDRW